MLGIGYGFGDEVINNRIFQWLSDDGQNQLFIIDCIEGSINDPKSQASILLKDLRLFPADQKGKLKIIGLGGIEEFAGENGWANIKRQMFG